MKPFVKKKLIEVKFWVKRYGHLKSYWILLNALQMSMPNLHSH